MKTDLIAILREKFHFGDFREGQEEIVEALLSGQDVVAVMPTGSGKSLCYQLPAMIQDGITLVISPLIALMKDQVDALTRNNIPATFINSALSATDQQQRLQAMRRGEYKLVYVAPERFRSQAFMNEVQNCQISLLAIDEAHCISEWGHDFRPDYLRIKPVIALLKHPPVVALTATATPDVRQDIVTQLGLNNPLSLVTGFDRPNLHFQVKSVDSEKMKLAIISGLLQGNSGNGIIYAATRKNVEIVATELQSQGYRAEGYHAGLAHDKRKQVQERFARGALPIVVATNAFGMGIDKADLRFIIHYDIPGSLEAYYQEIGRAGRDGKPAYCLLLFNYADTKTQEFFIEASYPPRTMIEELYQILCNVGQEEIELTLKSLAGMITSSRASEMAVSSCLKILEKNDFVERGNEGEHQAMVTVGGAPDLLRSRTAKAKLQKRVLAYLLKMFESAQKSTVAVDLATMENSLNLTAEQLRRALAALHDSGCIVYHAPFRGRGVRILKRVSNSKLAIDYSELNRRATFERKKLRKMVEYAYTDTCLRSFILAYFGETAAPRQCHNCSNCRGQTQVAPATRLSDEQVVIVKKILSCVARMSGKFGRMRVAQVLTGSRAKSLECLGLISLSTYGILQEFGQPAILEIMDALVAAGLLKTVGDDYPLLQLTPAGTEAMMGRQEAVMVFPVRKYDKELATEPAPRTHTTARSERKSGEKKSDEKKLPPPRLGDEGEPPYDEELFTALRQMRSEIAEQRNVPAYVVFHDAVLKNISRELPLTEYDLLAIKGIGKRKLEQYGTQLLAIVQEYLGRARQQAQS